jgi:hypothetical protein
MGGMMAKWRQRRAELHAEAEQAERDYKMALRDRDLVERRVAQLRHQRETNGWTKTVAAIFREAEGRGTT